MIASTRYGVACVLAIGIFAFAEGSTQPANTRSVRVRVDALFPRNAPHVLTLVERAESGAVLSRTYLEEWSGQAAVALLPESTSVELSTPVHEPCARVLAEETREVVCQLKRKVIINPLSEEGAGRLWLRRVKENAFQRVDPLPPAWGKGFAIAQGSYDLVLAPPARCATLRFGVPILAPNSLGVIQSGKGRPSAISARLLTSQKSAVTDSPVLEVRSPSEGITGPKGDKDGALLAWSEFFRDEGLMQAKDGSVLLSPAPCQPLWVLARFPHRRPVSFSTDWNTEGVLELGEIVLPELGTLTARVDDQLETGSEIRGYALVGNLHRPAWMLPMPGPLSRHFEIPFPDPHSRVTVEVFPGQWLLEVRVNGRTFGERTVEIEERDSSDETFVLKVLRVAGRVESGKGVGIPGVKLSLVYKTDGLNPHARVISDKRGEFEVGIPYVGGAFTLVVSAPGGGMRFQTVDPAKEDVERLQVRLGAGTVSVAVRDKVAGNPVAGVSVTARLQVGSANLFPKDLSDENGSVVFSNLDDGSFSIVEAMNDEWIADLEDLGGTSKIARNEPEPHFDIPLKAAKKVRVQIFGRSGANPPGASLLGPISGRADRFPRQLQQDPDGAFSVIVPRDEVLYLAAFAPGHRLRYFSVDPTQKEVRVDLNPKRLTPSVSFRGADEERPIAISVSMAGVGLPSLIFGQAMSICGCSVKVPTIPSQSQFDQCLDDGGYLIGGQSLSSGASIPLVPSSVQLVDGRTVVVRLP